MSEWLENSLRQALTDMRYTSTRTGLQRGFMAHHIEAILGAVMPVVEPIDTVNGHLVEMVNDAAEQKREAEARVQELEAALDGIERRCGWLRDDIRERDKVLCHELSIRCIIAQVHSQYARAAVDGDGKSEDE